MDYIIQELFNNFNREEPHKANLVKRKRFGSGYKENFTTAEKELKLLFLKSKELPFCERFNFYTPFYVGELKKEKIESYKKIKEYMKETRCECCGKILFLKENNSLLCKKCENELNNKFINIKTISKKKIINLDSLPKNNDGSI